MDNLKKLWIIYFGLESFEVSVDGVICVIVDKVFVVFVWIFEEFCCCKKLE